MRSYALPVIRITYTPMVKKRKNNIKSTKSQYPVNVKYADHNLKLMVQFGLMKLITKISLTKC